MAVLDLLFGWVPEIVAEWGLYGVLLAVVGVLTEVGVLGTLLMLCLGGLTGGLSYLKRLGSSFSGKDEGRWDLLGSGVGVVAALLLMGLVIGPSGIADAQGGGLTWGTWLVALLGGAVAVGGVVLRSSCAKGAVALRVAASALLSGGITIGALYLLLGIIEVSQNAIVF